MKARQKGRHPERRPVPKPTTPAEPSAEAGTTPKPEPVAVVPAADPRPKVDPLSTALIRIEVGQQITFRMMADETGKPFILVLPA